MGGGSCSKGDPGKYGHGASNNGDGVDATTAYFDNFEPLEWDECIDPLTILPEQFFCNPQPSAVALWLRKLMMAILIDVIRLLGPRTKQGRASTTMRFAKQRVRRKMESNAAIVEAEKWVAKDDNDYPFSFVNVCETLSLNVEVMRKYLSCKGRDRLKMARREV